MHDFSTLWEGRKVSYYVLAQSSIEVRNFHFSRRQESFTTV